MARLTSLPVLAALFFVAIIFALGGTQYAEWKKAHDADVAFARHRGTLLLHPEMVVDNLQNIPFDRSFTTDELELGLALSTGQRLDLDTVAVFKIVASGKDFFFARENTPVAPELRLWARVEEAPDATP